MNSNYMLLGACSINNKPTVKTKYLHLHTGTHLNDLTIYLYDNLSDVGNSNYFAMLEGDSSPIMVDVSSHPNKIYAFIWWYNKAYDPSIDNDKYKCEVTGLVDSASPTGCTVEHPNSGYNVPKEYVWEITFDSTKETAVCRFASSQDYHVQVLNADNSVAEVEVFGISFNTKHLKPGDMAEDVYNTPSVTFRVSDASVYGVNTIGSYITKEQSGNRYYIKFDNHRQGFDPKSLGVITQVYRK